MTQSTVSTVSIPTHALVQLPTTMGLDLSDRVAHFEVQRGDGVVLSSGRVSTTREQLKNLFVHWKGCRLVIEAGGHSPWISRLASECGMDVVVANPRKVDLISKNDRKTDRKDAEMLAEMGRTNVKLLHPIQHRSSQAQFDLAVPRARDEVMRCRTSLINHVRGVLKSNGYRAPNVSANSFSGRVKASIPLELTAALQTIVELIGTLTEKIKEFDRQLEQIAAERYPVTQLLRQVHGVGPIVSLVFLLTLDDPQRFRSARDVGAYLGLVPRKRGSGDKDPQLHINKAGDASMRRLLVIAANFILGPFGPDCDLRRFGEKIAGSGNDRIAKKRARIAVARKLAVVMFHLWRTGAAYDPFYTAKKRGEFAVA